MAPSNVELSDYDPVTGSTFPASLELTDSNAGPTAHDRMYILHLFNPP
jgi:hypothetical protein